MSDPHLALQDAVLAALKGASVADGRVHDEPPTKPTFPYVTFGDGQTLPDKADCINGSEIFLRLDVWSRKVGYVQTKEMVAAIVAALDDAELVLAGHRLIDLQQNDVQYMRDPDGLTRHAALTFRALTEPA